MRRLLVFFMVIPLLCACSRIPETYSFAYEGKTIACVELLNNYSAVYTGQEFTVIRNLSEDEIPAFMDMLSQLETRQCITPPPRNFGPHIVRVTYADGDMELFGSWHIEFVEKGQSVKGVGAYCFSEDDFENLFMEYAYK